MIPHDAALYRSRHKIEIEFGRLKDWRRIRARHERCAHIFVSAVAIAACKGPTENRTRSFAHASQKPLA